MSSEFGRGLQVSDNGQVMAWIRTNRTSFGAVSGPVLSAVYQGAKKGWSDSVQIPGTAETTGLQLSADGKSALIVSDFGWGIARADDEQSWTAPTTFASDGKVVFAHMSFDAQTVVWASESYVDQPPDPNWPPSAYPYKPPPILVRTLKSRTVAADGQWGAETVVGQMDPASSLAVASQVVLSGDGKTLVWLAEGKSLVAATRSDSGTWPPTVIRKYGGNPEVFSLRISANGERLFWSRATADGIFTSTRSGSTWSQVGNVTVDSSSSFAVSPKAKSVAWGSDSGKIKIASLSNGQWRLVASVGSGRALYPDVFLGKKDLFWINKADDSMRSATLKSGAWSKARTVSKDAFEAVLSRDGKTVAWSQTSKKRILSSTR